MEFIHQSLSSADILLLNASIKPIPNGYFKDYICPYSTPLLQYRMGVRLPLLQPRTRALHLANGDGVGIVGNSCTALAPATALGETRKGGIGRPSENIWCCYAYGCSSQAMYDVRTCANLAHRRFDNKHLDTSYRVISLGNSRCGAADKDEGNRSITWNGGCDSDNRIERPQLARQLLDGGKYPNPHLGVCIGSIYGVVQAIGGQVPHNNHSALDILRIGDCDVANRRTRYRHHRFRRNGYEDYLGIAVCAYRSDLPAKSVIELLAEVCSTERNKHLCLYSARCGDYPRRGYGFRRSTPRYAIFRGNYLYWSGIGRKG